MKEFDRIREESIAKLYRRVQNLKAGRENRKQPFENPLKKESPIEKAVRERVIFQQ